MTRILPIAGAWECKTEVRGTREIQYHPLNICSQVVGDE
jgi:hypothetical protein